MATYKLIEQIDLKLKVLKRRGVRSGLILFREFLEFATYNLEISSNWNALE